MTGALVGNIISFVGLSVSATEVDTIVSIVCSCVGLLITIISIVLSVIKWWKKASEDNKITSEEIDELIHLIEDKKEDFQDKNKKENKDDELK